MWGRWMPWQICDRMFLRRAHLMDHPGSSGQPELQCHWTARHLQFDEARAGKRPAGSNLSQPTWAESDDWWAIWCWRPRSGNGVEQPSPELTTYQTGCFPSDIYFFWVQATIYPYFHLSDILFKFFELMFGVCHRSGPFSFSIVLSILPKGRKLFWAVFLVRKQMLS